ncbi:hypothetical protein BH11BAC3_BH11BAC3_02380 [soil metagenome]
MNVYRMLFFVFELLCSERLMTAESEPIDSKARANALALNG